MSSTITIPNSFPSLATLGGGCFWGLEDRLRGLSGVMETSVGYMGGSFEQPSYLDVLSRITGHAEVVQVQYDPAVINYYDLLVTFLASHDPTSFNRQGADRGEQYRSVIFYHDSTQAAIARQTLDLMAAQYSKPIVTQLCAASAYWLATPDHQHYLEKRRLLQEAGHQP